MNEERRKRNRKKKEKI